MKKVIKILVWLFVTCYLVIILGFVGHEYQTVPCRDLKVVIKDSTSLGFVDAALVVDFMQDGQEGLLGRPISVLDIREMESRISSLRSVKKAEIYRTVEGILVAEIEQRKPVVRITDKQSNDYYLDREGNVIPLRRGFSPHLLFVNGNIDPGYGNIKNIYTDAIQGREPENIQSLHEIAKYISEDNFLNSQIIQIYIESNGEMELVPRVGSQRIFLGKASDYQTKFENLKLIYREGFSRKGWNNYETINLKYKNQVICTKR